MNSGLLQPRKRHLELVTCRNRVQVADPWRRWPRFPGIVDELEFQGRLITWTTEAVSQEPNLPFGGMVQEKPRPRKGKMPQRRDIVLVDRRGSPLVSGELRLPDHPEGHTPDVFTLVEDAHQKAVDLGVKYFFTWNINDAIVWTTDDLSHQGLGLMDRRHRFYDVTDIANRRELDDPAVEEKLRAWWRTFLRDLADSLAGRAPARVLPLDEQFVALLEVALKPVIRAVHQGLARRFVADLAFARQLNRWMIRDQQWTFESPDKMRTVGIAAAAKLAAYTLMVRLVFYEALRRQFPILAGLNVPARVGTASELDVYLQEAFRQAQTTSGDYDTIFTFDFADSLALIDDSVVASWSRLIASIDRYDFTALKYEVVGLIFQRLIDPEERHKYGQYFTKPTIVDFINGFCVRNARAIYLDPAAGGGTFAVRAYARKQHLDPGLSHQELLGSIWASDIARFATELCTVNLATRQLVAADNFPLVVQRDFFDVVPQQPFIQLPRQIAGLKELRVSKGRHFYALPQVDVIASNLPYVRQEHVDKPKVERALQLDYHGRVPPHSKRSDLHVYFWMHAWQLLAPHGYFGFLTSSSWLETGYGFRLQEFLLERFAIKVIAESEVEPWFSDARVATVCTIAQREDDARRRDENLIRFVTFRQPLNELLPTTNDENIRQQAVDQLVGDIESVTTNTVEGRWRVRVVRQDDLRAAGEMRGVRKPVAVGADLEVEDDDDDGEG